MLIIYQLQLPAIDLLSAVDVLQNNSGLIVRPDPFG